VYFLGLVALFLFDDQIGRFKVFPGSGAYQDAHTIFGKFGALIMPWFVLAASFAAVYARFLRGNLIDTLQEDYIRTARAKGLPESTVVLKHGLRSTLTPVLTIFGLDLGLLLGGAILTETTFSLPGLGQFTILAIQNQDLPEIMGVVMIASLFIILANLVVDILYAVADPRVRL
jgi:peptide/nickel transport system permease protein